MTQTIYELWQLLDLLKPVDRHPGDSFAEPAARGPNEEQLEARALAIVEKAYVGVAGLGKELLRRAAAVGALEIVRYLLARGFEPDSADDQGRTALHEASRGFPAVVAELLAAGAVVDTVDRRKKTPLCYAAAWGDPKVVRLLIDAGANPRTLRKTGFFPLKAVRGPHKSTVEELLREAYRKSPSFSRGLSLVGRRSGRIPQCGFGRFRRNAPNRWFFLAFRAPIDEVGQALTSHFNPLRLIKDVAGVRVADGEVLFLLRFAGSDWTLLPQWQDLDRGQLKIGSTLGETLSREIEDCVACISGEDSGEALAYELFERGSCREARMWYAYENRAEFRASMAAFHRLNLYIPRCQVVRDGFDAWLELHRHRATDIERLDVVFLRQPAWTSISWREAGAD